MKDEMLSSFVGIIQEDERLHMFVIKKETPEEEGN